MKETPTSADSGVPIDNQVASSEIVGFVKHNALGDDGVLPVSHSLLRTLHLREYP